MEIDSHKRKQNGGHDNRLGVMQTELKEMEKTLSTYRYGWWMCETWLDRVQPVVRCHTHDKLSRWMCMPAGANLLFWMSGGLRVLRVSGNLLFWVSDNLRISASLLFWRPGGLRVLRFSGDLLFWVSDSLIVLRSSDYLLFWDSDTLGLWEYLAVYCSECLTVW